MENLTLSESMVYDQDFGDEASLENLGNRKVIIPKRLTRTPLPEEQVRNNLVDPAMYQNRGIVLWYVNGNFLNSCNMIGGTRLQLEDLRLLPLWLMQNEDTLKKKAVACLKKHLNRTQNAVGVNESNISLEDYGIGYAVASLSALGKTLNPDRRAECPLSACFFDALTEPVLLRYLANGEPDVAHIVYVYIHLLPTQQRAGPVRRRMQEDKEQANDLKRQRLQQGNRRFGPPGQAGPYPYPAQGYAGPSYPAYPEQASASSEAKIVDAVLKQLGPSINNPPLEKKDPPIWVAESDEFAPVPK